MIHRDDAPAGAGDTEGAPRSPGTGQPFSIDEVVIPAGRRDLRRLPRLVGSAVRLVWQAAPRELAIAGAVQVLAGVSLAAQLLLARRVLEGVTGAAGPSPELVSFAPELVAFGVLLLVVAAAAVAGKEQQRTLAELVQQHTTGLVMDVSTSVDLLSFDRPSFYDRLQRATVNAMSRPLEIVNGLLALASAGIAVLAVAAALLWLEPLVAGLIALGVVPALYTNRLGSRLLHAYTVRHTPHDRRRGYLYQALTRKEEAQEVRAFDSADYLRREYDRLYEAKVGELRGVVRRRLCYGLLNAVVAAAVTIGSVALLLAFVSAGRLDVATAATAVGAVIIVAGRLRGVVAGSGALYEGALFLGDFTDFTALAPHRDRAAQVPATPAGFHEIELDGVGFTYPSRREPSLRDVSLRVRRGDVIALVGENGSGKTTLTKLLAGLYAPTVGTVRWDAVDVAELEPASVRASVTVIFQDFVRYFLTARENIGISRTDRLADDGGEVELAAARAGAHAFLAGLDDGYDTLLGPAFAGGSDLSTGQWQRVALARAYFRDAPLLILDEPTASLDPRGEYEIFEQVRRLAEGRTVILVSHRFSSVRAADRIVVLDSGRVVEEGTHDALLARGGLYADLYTLQASGYESGARSAPTERLPHH